MDWTAQLFMYCERGSDPTFWAEPVNALSNVAFLTVALLATDRLARQQVGRPVWNRSQVVVRAGLILLVAMISIGSFLFHTYATRWAKLCDVIPIGLFMFAYLSFAVHNFLQLPAYGIRAVLGLFAIATYAAAVLTGADGQPYLNGTLGYLPALLALAIVGRWLVQRGDPAARWFLMAGATFAVSMVLRALDQATCGSLNLFGHGIGTHVLWHINNAATLHFLLLAALVPTSRQGGGERAKSA